MKATCVKARFSKLVRFLSLLCLAVWALAPPVYAQTPPVLDIHLYAGLTVTGAVGTVYSIQYTTNLVQTNHWLTLTNLLLPASPHLWVDTTCPVAGQRFYRAIMAETPTDMALIPPGAFAMGNTFNDGAAYERPVHAVYLSAFYMDTNLVTKNLWDEVKLWNAGNGYQYDLPGSGKAGTHPVQSISWCAAVKWCNARSEKESLTRMALS
jgi:formylglycine-generating enzyme required for sulfatase activity